MPKQKTKKAVVKRMKLTKSGEVKRHQAFTSHLLVRKTTKRKRQLRKALIVEGAVGKHMKKLLTGV
jgi:large subunit ribosomal protein L35